MGPPLSIPPQLIDVAVVAGVLKALSRSAKAAYLSLMAEKVDVLLLGVCDAGLDTGADALLPSGTKGAEEKMETKEDIQRPYRPHSTNVHILREKI